MKPLTFTSGLTPEGLARREATRALLLACGWTAIRDCREADLVSSRGHRTPMQGGQLIDGTVDGPLSDAANDVFDHPYTLRHVYGLKVYVGEPYPQPLEQAAPMLPALCGDVYTYQVRPDLALHNPVEGGTVAVLFYDKHEAKRIEKLLPAKRETTP